MTTGPRLNLPLYVFDDGKVGYYLSELRLHAKDDELSLSLILGPSRSEPVPVTPVADVENSSALFTGSTNQVDSAFNSYTVIYGLRDKARPTNFGAGIRSGGKVGYFFVYKFTSDLKNLVAISFIATDSSKNRRFVFILLVPEDDVRELLQSRQSHKFTHARKKVQKLEVNVKDQKRILFKWESTEEETVFAWKPIAERNKPSQRVYPFIVTTPLISLLRVFNGDISKVNESKASFYIVRDVIAQSLLGSWLILNDSIGRWQFGYIIPTNLFGKHLSSIPAPSPLHLFSSVSASAATFIFEVNLQPFIEKMQSKGFEEMDPKALLKALMFKYVASYPFELSENKGDIFKYLPIPISERSLHVGVNLGSKHFRLAYRYIDTLSLENILRELYLNLKENSSYAATVQEKLLNAYLETLEKRILKRAMELSNLKHLEPETLFAVKRPERRKDRLLKAATIALAELGLHAISHLLMHYIHEEFGVPFDSMREILVLKVPRREWFGKVMDGRLFKIIDGYVYIYADENNKSPPTGYVLVSVDQDFSFESIAEKIELLYAQGAERQGDDTIILKNTIDVLQKMLNRIGEKENGEDDPCYKRWEHHRSLYEKTLSSLAAGELGQLQDIREDLEKAFGSVEDSPYSRLYYPLSQFRRLLLRVTDNEELKPLLKKYAQAIYSSEQPICFDGCYNCTMLAPKRCGTKNPILSEWLTSKAAARLILLSVKESGG